MRSEKASPFNISHVLDLVQNPTIEWKTQMAREKRGKTEKNVIHARKQIRCLVVIIFHPYATFRTINMVCYFAHTLTFKRLKPSDHIFKPRLYEY